MKHMRTMMQVDFMDRAEIVKQFNQQLDKGRKLIGVSVGNGMSAKNAEKGGADFVLALNSGKFRQMGQGSLAGFLPYANCNSLVMDFGKKEIITVVRNIPVLFGLCATDPTIHLEEYIGKIRAAGFSGINNYPTIGMLDGVFREALEEEGIVFEREVEAIRIAHDMGLFTVAFVFDETQTRMMMDAGADVICAHLGITNGGELSLQESISLKEAIDKVKKILLHCDTPFRMVYGGPVYTSQNVLVMYENTPINGYIGGSSFERIPLEAGLTRITNEFKQIGNKKPYIEYEKHIKTARYYDYIEFIVSFIEEHYDEDISFGEFANMLHLSRTYLSSLFRKDVGCTFPEYLTKFRIQKAIELMEIETIPLSELAFRVGYNDYTHFSKTFKKITGKSPTEYFKG